MDNLNPLIGAIIGDILGFPYEMCDELPQLEKLPKIGENPKWSDDSSMLLATYDAILKHDVNAPDFTERLMDNFVDWYYNNNFSPVDHVVDIGCTTENAIENYTKTHDIYTCGETDEWSHGNGALMRILPFIYTDSVTKNRPLTKENIFLATGLTHNNELCKLVNLHYVYIVEKLVRKIDCYFIHPRERLQTAIMGMWHMKKLTGQFNDIDTDALRRKWDNHPSLTLLIDSSENEVLDMICCQPERLIERKGYDGLTDSDGFVLTAFSIAIWANLTSDSFEEVILKIINLGGDTDTNACIAGGIAVPYSKFQKNFQSLLRIF